MSISNPLREQIITAIHQLDHVLPGQAPIHDFVHHNTLHGFQHLPFEEALVAFTELTGIDCYLPQTQFRQFYQQGRITDTDLTAALADHFPDAMQTSLLPKLGLSQQQLYKQALLSDLSPISAAQLQWQLPCLDAELWQGVLTLLNIHPPNLHPEQFLDLSSQQAEDWLINCEQSIQQTSLTTIKQLFAQVGDQISLRSLIFSLSGQDILEQVRPQLIRLTASLLDEGMAAWRLPYRQSLGLYAAWRDSAQYDAQHFFEELRGWQPICSHLPDNAIDAIIQQLQALEIPSERWAGYLQRIALELPGWSGLINWRQTHPHYQADDNTQPLLADYLALRLTLDHIYLHQICNQQWHCAPRLDKLQTYFNTHSAEFVVRQALFSGQLPEYLSQAAHSLLADLPQAKSNWQSLAEKIWTWQHSPLAHNQAVNVYQHGWQFYQLCLGLGLNATTLAQLNKAQALQWLDLLEQFTDSQRRQVWLNAYERHYQQDLLQALHANHRRGRWAQRNNRPQAQVVFCMDDREESIRRHLEEHNPALETLGAAGFFGVAMNYQGLDDSQLTPLCPVVVTPSHNVEERNTANQSAIVASYQRGKQWQQSLSGLWQHGLRRNALLSASLLPVVAPLSLAGLLTKSWLPHTQQQLLKNLSQRISPTPDTRLHFTADEDSGPASPKRPRLGFTNQEQAERIAGFLRNTGLTYGFAELVVLMGHGSMSQNNPHLSAYDCGACSGRHGGPNARLFAAMANRPEVRALLAERGIVIPDDTWFIGAEHNTCDENITWYDLADMPTARQSALASLQQHLQYAQHMSAHERCRRLASAPRLPSPQSVYKHFLNRSADFSQARPELGHATNAAALVGRRSVSQGAFFDRRLFLISYDPTQDSSGNILEGILLAVGPVGAGINLEYYFSTVNNDKLGCGSKVPHNLTGMFAVMEGTGSDLRTGLPKQMVEIHEAMRLQIVVEAKTSVLEAIYGRQDSLRELIGGGWVHLTSIDPDSGEIFVFQRGTGFVAWQPSDVALPLRDNSQDCYRQETMPVSPKLIWQQGL